MIDIEAVNPFNLPCVDLSNKRRLPTCAAIYFVFDETQTILYIGRTENLAMRWLSHHRYKDVKNSIGVKIAWIEFSDVSLLETVETALIDYFDPVFNVKPGTVKRPNVWNHGIKSRLDEWMRGSEDNYSTLAIAVGVDVGAVRRLAKNQFSRVDCETWEKVCNHYKKPLGDLFYMGE